MQGTRFPNLVGRCCAIAALATFWSAAANPARADRLDVGLNEKAPQILKALRGHNIQNVGVLRFRVKHGNKPESFDVGSLNGSMVQRLENALIVHLGSDEKAAIGVIHDAGKAVNIKKVGNWYKDTSERRKLFDVSTYHLAWGDKKVKADAFLTGLIKTSDDYKKTTVTVELFSAKEPSKLEKVAEFSFDTDVSLLQDLGKSYTLRGRNLPKTSAGLRALTFARVREADDNTVMPTDGDSVMVGDIEFRLLADGKPVTIKPATADNPGGELICPDVGTKSITFSISNKSADKTLGVDVKLAGKSLLFEQNTENCRVWVLKPGATNTLMGYYIKDDTLDRDTGVEKTTIVPCKIIVGEDAKAKRADLGEQAAIIKINVFSPSDETIDSLVISERSLQFRGLPPSKEKAARRTLRSLQNSLLKSAALKRSVRGGPGELIVADTEAVDKMTKDLATVDFPRTPVPTATLQIKIVPAAAP